ncbi:MAG: acyltransferase domain-containing protein, partial [Pseudomonadota bacterium]|nr:acyltransferase domain-containing protein [Pseudomonadota bacterium]
GAYLAEDSRLSRDLWAAEVFVWNRHNDLVGELETLIHALDEGPKPMLRDLAFTLYKRWDSSALSVAIVAKNLNQFKELAGKLAVYLSGRQGELPEGVFVAEEPLGTAGKVAALFPGQGSQYPDMLRELGILFPKIMDTLCEADEIFETTSEYRPDGPVRLSPLVFPPGRYDPDDEKRARAALMRTNVAQPALGAIEAGLWEFMRQCLGFTAHMTAGHSYGEYVALYAAGCLDFSDLIRLSEARGRFIMQAANGSDLGAMAAVQAERKQVERIASEFSGLQVANHNAPTQSILAGSSDAIDAVVTKLTEEGYTASRLPVAAAFHSPFVEPASKALEAFMADIRLNEAAIPVYSNTTASAHPTDAAGIRANLVEQLSKPVEFVAEIEAMYNAGARVFVEIGPKGVLSRLVELILQGRSHLSIAVEGADKGLVGLLNALASLTAHGVALDLGILFTGRDCREISFDDLAGSSREQMPPAHAWMLNGSGARRVGEPVREIGVTLEQAATRRAATDQQDVTAAETVDHVESRNAGANMSSHVRASLVTREYRRRGTMLNDHNDIPEAGGDRGYVLESYFETMRQFLHTQADVMTTYLDSAASRRRLASPARTLSAVSQRPELALARPQTKMASQSAAPEPLRQSAIPDQPQPPVAVAPVASMPKRAPAASAMQASQEPPPGAQAGKPATDDAAAGKGNGKVNGLTKDSLVERVLTIVEDRTGYPRDMIGMDQNMEADLGIDSIKRVEIAGALVKELPADVLDRLGDDRDQINTQKTLGEIVNLIADKALVGGESRPFDQTGAGTRQQASAHLPRFIMRAQPEPQEEVRLESVKSGTYLITADGN